MESITCRFHGIEPLLTNNPQTVDPFNPYAKAMKQITAKRKKTDDDLLELRRIERKSKVYFDDELGAWVPASWVTSAIAKISHARAKISKAEIRSGVFPTQRKLKLAYEKQKSVKTIDDIVDNPFFSHLMLLKQGQVKVAKSAPIFHDWEFGVELEFDPTVVDRSTLESLLAHAAMYGGFGDFRPTYGRAKMEVL